MNTPEVLGPIAAVLRPSHLGLTLGAKDWVPLAGQESSRTGWGQETGTSCLILIPLLFMANFRLNFSNYSPLSLILSFIQEGEKHTRVSLEEEIL